MIDLSLIFFFMNEIMFKGSSSYTLVQGSFGIKTILLIVLSLVGTLVKTEMNFLHFHFILGIRITLQLEAAFFNIGLFPFDDGLVEDQKGV